MNDILSDLQARGLVFQVAGEDALREHLAAGSRTLYCGFDPTADSLHVGSLVPLLTLRRFQLAGHKPLALVGGATGLIGDPSFKDRERQLNTPQQVAGWVEKIKAQVSAFIDFDCGENAAEVVNNLDWTANLNVLDFLRDVGKHFSVNAMIQKTSIKQRIEREDGGISFTEFAYMILQSYDFAELHRRHGCTLQIGGSDQWGNITAGIDLTRRLHGAQVHGLTVPLVTKADGTKFGKTEAGTVWLDPARTSPYAFYQFWFNTADADAYTFLRYFTFLGADEIAAIERADRESSGRPEAQSILASEVTRLVHGDEGFNAVLRITQALFGDDDTMQRIKKLSADDMQQLRLDGLPATTLQRDGLGVVVEPVAATKPQLSEKVSDKAKVKKARAGSAASAAPSGKAKVERARAEPATLTSILSDVGVATGKQVKDALGRGAVLVNGHPLSAADNTDLAACFDPARALHGRFYLVKLGKKKYHLFEVA